MFKKLLNKGFKPTYYTNADWFESRVCKTRLFYKYNVESKELLNILFNITDTYNKYFYLLENDNLITYIEVDENLESFWIYFYNADGDSIKLLAESMDKVLDILPNKFEFECAD